MGRAWAIVALAAPLAGCGLADSGTATASGAASATREAAQARQTEDLLRDQIDAATRQATEQRRAAEADGR